MYANSPHGHGLMAAPAGFNRSFSDMSGFQQHAMDKPQIYTVCPRPANLSSSPVAVPC
jgi:regulatory protein SWI6